MPIILGVALLSASALAFEVLLVRLFAIVHWHHFAYMIISLALLGYGASGTVLTFVREPLARRFVPAFAGLAAAFGVSVPLAFAAAQTVPLNALALLWDPLQPLLLTAVFLILAVPFFFAASAIGLALYARRDAIAVLYRADLAGAGAGAGAVVAAMFVLPPPLCLKAIAAAGLIVSAGALVGTAGNRRWSALALAGAVAATAWPAPWLEPHPSPYKELSRALQIPGRHVIHDSFGPLGRLTAVTAGSIPFRYAPGLGVTATAEPPPQVAVFTDGGSMTAVTRVRAGETDLGYLDRTPEALPYHLLAAPRVLVLGAGGGSGILLARHHGARRIDAVEINPRMARLLATDLADFAGNLPADPRVRLHVAEARAFVGRSRAVYDLVHISLLDSLGAATGGLLSLSESTLYTVEAFSQYLGRLAPGGLLAVTRWLRVPPRDSLRLAATAAAALERAGYGMARERIAVIRGPTTITLIVKPDGLSPADGEAVRAFCRERAFDMAYLPGLAPAEANRFNILERPYVFIGVSALLGPRRATFLEAYKYDVAPVTDDRPFFFHFMKWRTLAELWTMRGAGLHLVEWGTPVLAATLALAVAVGAILMLVPLFAAPSRRPSPRGPPIGRFSVFFLAVGFAFLFVEIAFIHRFVLFLGHPLYAVAVVLAAFLVSAGLGSGAAPAIARRWGNDRGMAVAVAAIAILAGLILGLLPVASERLVGLPQAARVAIALAAIAPLAFFMGMPFPLALATTARTAPGLIPWAWAINGCASVIGAVLATGLALCFGFSVVVLVAVALYALAALAFRAMAAAVSPNP